MEALPGLDENRHFACRGPVAANVNVERVELDPSTDATGFVCGDEGRARAEERIDDDVAASSEVEKSVLEQGGRLNGWMGDEEVPDIRRFETRREIRSTIADKGLR
jgi:hypothetical protein